MAAMSSRTQDQMYWLECAESLGPESAPPINQVILIIFLVGEILAHAEPGLDLEVFSTKPSIAEYEYRTYVIMFNFIMLNSLYQQTPRIENCIDIVWIH